MTLWQDCFINSQLSWKMKPCYFCFASQSFLFFVFLLVFMCVKFCCFCFLFDLLLLLLGFDCFYFRLLTISSKSSVKENLGNYCNFQSDMTFRFYNWPWPYPWEKSLYGKGFKWLSFHSPHWYFGKSIAINNVICLSQ